MIKKALALTSILLSSSVGSQDSLLKEYPSSIIHSEIPEARDYDRVMGISTLFQKIDTSLYYAEKELKLMYIGEICFTRIDENFLNPVFDCYSYFIENSSLYSNSINVDRGSITLPKDLSYQF